MESRISLHSNPGIIIFGFIITILFTGGTLLAVFVNMVPGIIIIGVLLYAFYFIYKYLHETLKSRIITNDEGIRFILPDDEKLSFSWGEITHAGLFQDKKGKETLFVYKEPDDKLMSIGPEFILFNSLKEIVREKTKFIKFVQESDETLGECLKTVL